MKTVYCFLPLLRVCSVNTKVYGSIKNTTTEKQGPKPALRKEVCFTASKVTKSAFGSQLTVQLHRKFENFSFTVRLN